MCAYGVHGNARGAVGVDDDGDDDGNGSEDAAVVVYVSVLEVGQRGPRGQCGRARHPQISLACCFRPRRVSAARAGARRPGRATRPW
eukprot:6321156-Lingulodinium_polyedra.AAC.1